MKKAVIIYQSSHHGNTKKLVDAIAAEYPVDVFEVESAKDAKLEDYDLIGLASGIAFGKFYRKLFTFAAMSMPERKKLFFLYTCGKDSPNYTRFLRTLASTYQCEIVGSYGCLGYDTFGPFKLIGGLNKDHPTEAEIRGAVRFYGNLLLKC